MPKRSAVKAARPALRESLLRLKDQVLAQESLLADVVGVLEDLLREVDQIALDQVPRITSRAYALLAKAKGGR